MITSRQSLANSAMNNIDLILNHPNLSSFHLMALLILCISNISDAAEILSIGYILTVYKNSDGSDLSGSQEELLTAAVFSGMLVGGFMSGRLSDIIGRKPTLVSSLAINGIAAVLSGLAPSVEWLIVMRVIAGIGVGGSVPALFTLAAELFPESKRGAYLSVVGSFWMVGSILIASIAWIMLGKDINGHRIIQGLSWRWFAGVAALPSLTGMILTFLFIPESPRHLLEKKNYPQLLKTLHFIVDKCPVESDFVIESVSEIRHSLLPQDSITSVELPTKSGLVGLLRTFEEQFSQMPKDTIQAKKNTNNAEFFNILKQLVSGNLRNDILALTVIWFSISFGYYGISTWITVLFDKIGLSNIYFNAFLYALANLPGNLISVFFVERIGRKRLMGWSMGLASIGIFLFAFTIKSKDPVLIVGSACLFNACTTSGWNAINCLSTETFPTNQRSTAMGLLATVGRLGSIIAQFVNGSLSSNVVILLIVTSSIMFVGTLSVFFISTPPQISVVTAESNEGSESV